MMTNANPSRMITMLGVAVSVLIRLKNVPEDPVARLPRESQSGIIGVYQNVVLMSRSPLQEHTLVCRFLLSSVCFLLFLEDCSRRLCVNICDA